MQRTAGILIYNEVEGLDFAGPFEVFGISEKNQEKLYRCFTVAQHDELISTRNGLLVKPNFNFANCPDIDILIVPGGYGAEQIEIHNRVLLDWLVLQKEKVDILASVCTGAFLLAKAGIITNERVTTHWIDIDDLQKEYPALKVERNVKYIDNGSVMTAAGISAGIELALHIVEKENGKDTALQTARRMEYDWSEM